MRNTVTDWKIVETPFNTTTNCPGTNLLDLNPPEQQEEILNKVTLSHKETLRLSQSYHKIKKHNYTIQHEEEKKPFSDKLSENLAQETEVSYFALKNRLFTA